MKTLAAFSFLVFVFALSAFIGEGTGFDCTWLPFGEGTAQARSCAVANGDAQQVVDVATTNASGVVTSATGKFVCPGDAGKTVFIHKGTTNRLAVNTTTISVCTNATTVTLANNANATDTNVTMVWATGDSTAAITTQVTACKSDAASTYHSSNVFVGNVAGTVTLSGGYLVSGCVYDVSKNGQIPSFVGGGQDNTVLFFAPTITACTDPAMGLYANGSSFVISGVTFEMGGILQATTNPVVNLTSASQWQVNNVNIMNYGWSVQNGSALKLSSVQYGYGWNVIVQSGNAGGSGSNQNLGYLCDIGGAASEMNTWFCSNSQSRNLIFRNPLRSPTSTGPVTWISGGSDECADPLGQCTVVDTNSEADIQGAVLFSGIVVSPGAALYITDSNIGRFNSSTLRESPANVASTATVYTQQTTWRTNLGGKIVNYGSWVDGFGNVYQDCNSTTCVTKRPGQVFTGNQPITR